VLKAPTWQRRLVTIPVVTVGWLLTITLLPVLLVGALAIDLVRRFRAGIQAVAVRIVIFLLAYLTAEVAAVAGAFLVWLLAGLGTARQRLCRQTLILQRWWANAVWAAARSIFSLRLIAEGGDAAGPGPVLVLARHSSIVDNLLPYQLFTRRHGIVLRYVLKRELLLDPALDIAGNRLPNHFVDRGGVDTDRELAALRHLAADLREEDGVLIYPEGTRFTAEKQRRALATLEKRNRRSYELASQLEGLLPPRPGGVLALLDASRADVVVLAHHGLEGFARVKDIWAGGMVGKVVRVRMWRIPRAEIPVGRADRTDWLHRVWLDMDRWLVGAAALGVGDA
jgi:1-acyl-sn-glycerol-3-phosphate acyltransferase